MGVRRIITEHKNDSLFMYQLYWRLHMIGVNNRKRLDNVSFAERMYHKSGKTLDLENPRTFDEKLWWLKFHYHNPLETICTDKYLVRNYVTECGLKDTLNQLYAVYDKAEDIDFSTLPSPCFIKCNHTSGANFLFEREKAFNKKLFIRRFDNALRLNHYDLSREWNYKDIDPKIIVEKVLWDKNQGFPLDYRMLCFNGEPRLMMLDYNTCSDDGSHASGVKRNIYDMNMQLQDIRFSRDRTNKPIKIGKDIFDQMKEYAAILSKPFPFCRVDFYVIENRVMFGEITFYHAGGCNDIQPLEWDYRIGDWIDIDSVKNGPFFVE